MTRTMGGTMWSMRAGLALLAVFWLLLAGCARVVPILPAADLDVLDVRELPQDLTAYAAGSTDDWVFDRAEHEQFAVDFEARHFAPWTWTTTSYSNATEALWGVEAFAAEQGWGENLRVISQDRIAELIRRTDIDSFPSTARRAVTVASAHFRALPDARPFLGDPAHVGEGFPFDYLQNSIVWPGTPVLVTHATDNGAWLFAEAGYVSGWVQASDLAWVDDDFVARFRTGLNAVVLSDDLEIIDETGTFRFRAHLGTLLPMVDIDATAMTVLVPGADAERHAVLRRALVLRGQVAPWPLPPTTQAVAMVGNRMMGQPYGWGGMFENRDCSAMVRDLFSTFGVWLPRNSSKQARAGRFEDAARLAPDEKERLLLARGIPWRTLVALRGHVMLYIGSREGRALVFHDTWGVKVVKNGVESRHIIGKAVVTTLTPGAELDGATDLRERILGFTFLEPGLAGQGK